MTNHELYIEGINRVSCHMNGEVYIPTTSFSAPPAQLAKRIVKPLSEILEAEAAASAAPAKAAQDQVESNKQIIARLLTPTESGDDVPTGEAPQVMLSAAEAAGRKVRTLREILEAEAGGLADEIKPTVQMSAAANFRFSGRVLRLE